MQECELKLKLDAASADALEAAGLFTGPPRIIRQNAIYFDTPDHALAEAGFSLRIRMNGDARVQTIKAAGAMAGLFVRSEWERPVDDDQPVLDDATPLPALLGNALTDIAPLFSVENERRVWLQDGIEIALDRGRVVAGEGEAPLCEVELELKDGDIATLFTLARQINGLVRGLPAALSKADHGYRLITPADLAEKAAPIALTADMPVGTAFAAIAHGCLQHFLLNVPAVISHQDRRALHQSRVALRRLRSALVTFKPILDDRRVELGHELRWLAGELGQARDLDVLIGRTPDGPVRSQLIATRGDIYDQAIATLESDRARALMIDLIEWIATGSWQDAPDEEDDMQTPLREFAARVLDRFRRRVKKAGKHLADLDDEARHELRKSAKKLRYAAEFFAALYTRKAERRRLRHFVASLEVLQDELGALNDMAHAPQVLQRLGLDAEESASATKAERRHRLSAANEAYDSWIDAKRFWR